MLVLPIEDCTVKIKPSDAIVDFIKNKVEVDESSPANIKQIKSNEDVDKCVLLVKDIVWLNKKLSQYRKINEDKIYLHELLRDAKVTLPEQKIVPRNPVLDARVKKLIEQEKSRQYANMTKNVDPVRKYHPEDTIAYQMKVMNSQLIAVAQFVFSVITGFVFGFFGIQLIVGNLDFGFRLLLGIMFALIIALAEIYFLAKKLSEDYTYEITTSHAHSNSKVHQD